MQFLNLNEDVFGYATMARFGQFKHREEANLFLAVLYLVRQLVEGCVRLGTLQDTLS